MTEDPVLARLMGEGGRFEVRETHIDGRPVRVFANAPQSLARFIDQGRVHGSANFIVEPGQTLTFDDYFERVDRLAAHIAGRSDCPPGDVVALAARNSAAWMIAFSAIVLAGRIPALVNSRGNEASMLAAIQDGGARLLIADAKRHQMLARSGCTLPAICLDDQSAYPNVEHLSQVLGDVVSQVPEPVTAPDDVAVLMYTSGTTGRAKAAALSHRSMVLGVMNTQLVRRAILERMAETYKLDVEAMLAQMPQSSSLLIFPLFHTSGCSALFLTSLVNGDKLVLLPRWDVREALKAIEAEKVTAMTAVPTMLWDMLNAPGRETYDLSSLRAFSSGGQALPSTLLDAVRAAFPGTVFGTGYGMTEANGSIAQAVGEEFLLRPGSAGRIVPMADVQVVDEQGNVLPRGEAGELWVRSATLMNGYWLRGALNRPFRAGGWYATGDIGRVDEDGFIFIIDRKTDMVISGGENIYCAEVEQALAGTPHVTELAAFGVPDERLGESLVVAVVSPDPADLVRDAIAHRAEQALPLYRRPRAIHIQSDPLPRNAMDKVEKHRLREAFLASLEEGHS